MEGMRISILKNRRSESMGDLSTGYGETPYCSHRRRVNFSRTNQVRVFHTSLRSSSSSLGELNFCGIGTGSDGAVNRSVRASAPSIERLLQEENTRNGDVLTMSPVANRSVDTNQLEDLEERERTGSERSMSISTDDTSKTDHQSTSHSFFENSWTVTENNEEIPAASNEIESESYGSFIRNYALRTMSQCQSLENLSSTSQQSHERTNTSIRDMSSVEELRTSGNGDDGQIPGPSSQATNMNRSHFNLAQRVIVRNGDGIQYEKPPLMYFNLPKSQDFANPFRKQTGQKPLTRSKESPFSFGQFGCAKTPKRIMTDPTSTCSQTKQQSALKFTKKVVHTATSPLQLAPPLRKKASDIGFNCTLGMLDSSKNEDLRLNSFTSQFYCSTSIQKLANGDLELPTTENEAVGVDTLLTSVKVPSSLNTGGRESETESVCEGSYSHLDSPLVSETHDEDGSPISQSSPPSIIPESEEVFEESYRSLETGTSDEDDEDKGEAPCIINQEEHSGNTSDGNGTLVGDGTLESNRCEYQREKDGESTQNRDEDLEGELVEEDDDAGFEGDDDDDGDEDEKEENVNGVEVEAEEDGDKAGEENAEGELNEREEAESRGNANESEGSQVLQTEEIMVSGSVISPRVNASQFFEQSRCGRQSDRTHDENRNEIFVIEQESTLRVNNLDVALTLTLHQPQLQPLVPRPRVKQTNKNERANNEVHLPNQPSAAFEELYKNLLAISAKPDFDIIAKWAFLKNANVTKELSKLEEPEWQALLQCAEIKNIMGNSYIESIEVNRNRFRNPDPLYLVAVNHSTNSSSYFPDWARKQITSSNKCGQ